jgi:hypothetical protein
MSATDRQNKLLVAEDWKRIYQSYKNADFQSYDFENLRRVMINYLRNNYPEDFNDYIESSEYIALIDMIAFLGQSISFRIDLNARENFLELADRRDSVLRLARLVGYNPKRNLGASGLLKLTAVQTTEQLSDINGESLSGKIVGWNDKTNPSWHDQFIKIINASLPRSNQFGNPNDKAIIGGIPTEQYRFQSSGHEVPLYKFSKSIDGRSMAFEIISSTFRGSDTIQEEPPLLGNKLAFVYRNDGKGASSNTNGFFCSFKQGVLGQGTFTITQPSPNQSVDLDASNINNTDVWLYQLDSNGNEAELWGQVPSLEGNNVIYNSLNKNIRNIYSIVSRGNDFVSLMFSDGTFGTLPKGKFRAYYRTSNGLEYTIAPKDIRSVMITIPYISGTGATEELSLFLSLMSSVSNSAVAESTTSIKANAPATYYTQNRMITGEDYNIAPLSVNQEVIKVKSVNRSASGISRYFDLLDPTGKYSKTNLFSDDGSLYKEEYYTTFRFSYKNKTDIEAMIYNQLYGVLESNTLRDFYYSKYIQHLPEDQRYYFIQNYSETNLTNGYLAITDGATYTETGVSHNAGDSLLSLVNIGSLLKFSTHDNSIIWATVIQIPDSSRGVLILNDIIPSNAKLIAVIPAFHHTISTGVVNLIINLMYSNKQFGLRYDVSSSSWQVVLDVNLNIVSDFNPTENSTNQRLDSSWLILFSTDYNIYTIKYRQLRYIFESENQVRFYYDSSEKIYDLKSRSSIKDKIKVLSINKAPDSTESMIADKEWELSSEYIGVDGYIDTTKIQLTFSDTDDDGVVDNPEVFSEIVPAVTDGDDDHGYIVTQLSSDGSEFRLCDNSVIKFYNTTPIMPNIPDNGTYIYIKDLNLVKYVTANGLVLSEKYKVYHGRRGIKFQYVHNASYNTRIDPGVTNIVDIYVLTNRYDIAYRQWMSGALTDEPQPPSTDQLYTMLAPSLNKIKSVSDEIIYHPVKFKVLFGKNATTDVQAIFKVVKNSEIVMSDNDIKTKVLLAIKDFFNIQNWDFGDSFYFSELTAYVMNRVAPYIVNFIIVPKQPNLTFGNLYEIRAEKDQIFINGATVDDIEIISSITINSIGLTP